MIYKRYEFSKSLYGNEIKFIARNSIGMVVFRAESEKKLKQAIDNLYKERERQELLAAKAEAAKKAKPKRALFSAKTTEPVITEKPKPTVKPPTRLTKTQDGKFISKSQLEKTEPPRKKRFWS